MEKFEFWLEENYNLPIVYFESSKLIWSDTLKEDYIYHIKREIVTWKKLDPVIVYNYKNANFILEWNQRTGAYGELNMKVPCIVISNNDDFQKLKKMNIKLWNLINFTSLQDVHSSLSRHMYDIRRDKYFEYFDE